MPYSVETGVSIPATRIAAEKTALEAEMDLSVLVVNESYFIPEYNPLHVEVLRLMIDDEKTANPGKEFYWQMDYATSGNDQTTKGRRIWRTA